MPGALNGPHNANDISFILDQNKAASMVSCVTILRFQKGDNADFGGGVIDMRGVAPAPGTSLVLLTADVLDTTDVRPHVDAVKGFQNLVTWHHGQEKSGFDGFTTLDRIPNDRSPDCD